MIARRDVKGLIKALSYQKDSDVRQAAARALGYIKDARAVEPLIAALVDENPWVRYCAAYALGQIGDARSIRPLIAAIKDPEWNVPMAAAEALVQIGDVRAIEPLLTLLQDTDRDVREKAIEVLEKLGWQPEANDRGASYWLAKGEWQKCVEIGTPAIEPLIAALRDESRDYCAAAIRALGIIGDPRAVEPLIPMLSRDNVRQYTIDALEKIGVLAVESLIAALKDQSGYVRRAAAEALGKIGDPRAVEPLSAALKDEHIIIVREAAAKALGQIGDARAVEPLSAALKDSSDVSRAAAEALVKIGAPAVEALIAALKDKDGNLRRSAVEALGEIKDARAIEPLIAALGDESSGVRKAAAEALDQLGWKPARDESAAWYWATKGKWNACVDIGAPAVQSLITTLRSTNDPYTRRDVAQALVRLYQKSNISQTDREQILAVRDHLIRIHDDQPHIDEFKDCSNNRPHTDTELGVEFPL